MAAVEFQKAQCYFAGAIQIAALVFLKQQPQNILGLEGHLDATEPYFLDDTLLCTISTSGSVPVVHALTLILFYGKQSWYLLFLSTAVLGLSTGTLVYSMVWWQPLLNINNPGGPIIPINIGGLIGDTDPVTECGDYSVLDLKDLWCGTAQTLADKINVATLATSAWVWVNVICFICAFRTSYCLIKHATGFAPVKSRTANFAIIWHDVFFGKILNRVWLFMFVATWSMCFGYQFYLYSYFFRLSEVDNNWGFAQVVAITIQVRSLVEYGILEIHGIVEGTAYKLAAPLTVTQGKSASSVDASSEDNTTEIPPYARLFSHGKTF